MRRRLEINDLNMDAVKFANGATVLLRRAQVRDGSMVQQNIVREDGRRSVLLASSERQMPRRWRSFHGVKKATASDPPRRRRNENPTSCSNQSGIRDKIGHRRAAAKAPSRRPHRADDPDLPRFLGARAWLV